MARIERVRREVTLDQSAEAEHVFVNAPVADGPPTHMRARLWTVYVHMGLADQRVSF